MWQFLGELPVWFLAHICIFGRDHVPPPEGSRHALCLSLCWQKTPTRTQNIFSSGVLQSHRTTYNAAFGRSESVFQNQEAKK